MNSILIFVIFLLTTYVLATNVELHFSENDEKPPSVNQVFLSYLKRQNKNLKHTIEELKEANQQEDEFQSDDLSLSNNKVRCCFCPVDKHCKCCHAKYGFCCEW